MSWVSRVTHGIRQPSPVPNGYSGTGTVRGGYPCLTGTYHRYPGVPIPVLHLTPGVDGTLELLSGGVLGPGDGADGADDSREDLDEESDWRDITMFLLYSGYVV